MWHRCKIKRSTARPRRHLRLARASDGAVGATSGSRGSVGLGVAIGGGTVSTSGSNLELGHVDHRLSSSVATGTAGLRGLLVGGDVERDEEEQVRADDGDSGESGELLTSALAHIGSPGEVGRGEVGVRGKVNEA